MYPAWFQLLIRFSPVPPCFRSGTFEHGTLLKGNLILPCGAQWQVLALNIPAWVVLSVDVMCGSADVSRYRRCVTWFLEYSWKIWERKGRLLGLLSVSVEEEKVARWECCVRVVAGSRGKVLGDAWARQCGRQQSQALCKVVVRVTGHAHQVEGDGLQSGIADAPRPESWQVHLS